MRPDRSVRRLFLAVALLCGGCDRTETNGLPTDATGVNAAAVKTCRVAISSQMGLPERDVVIRDVTWSKDGVSVRATVDGVDAPWECLTDAAGQVAGVSFVGLEADN